MNTPEFFQFPADEPIAGANGLDFHRLKIGLATAVATRISQIVPAVTRNFSQRFPLRDSLPTRLIKVAQVVHFLGKICTFLTLEPEGHPIHREFLGGESALSEEFFLEEPLAPQ